MGTLLPAALRDRVHDRGHSRRYQGQGRSLELQRLRPLRRDGDGAHMHGVATLLGPGGVSGFLSVDSPLYLPFLSSFITTVNVAASAWLNRRMIYLQIHH